MTLQEKLKRLINPKCANDYGLSISLSDLMSFNIGRKWVKDFFNIKEENHEIDRGIKKSTGTS
ncbi:MAG: hypothetical protein E3J94_07170 [Desulfobacteraceae bacterium]|nr:MAG: hypothetical protein E3J94_07170 [Desulfobacteraceae bacterium]